MHPPCNRPHPHQITQDRAAIAYAEAEYDIGRSGGCGLATGIYTDIVHIVFLLFGGMGNHQLPFRFHHPGSEEDRRSSSILIIQEHA